MKTLMRAVLVLLGLGLVVAVILPSMVCVAEGTLVETPYGPRPVESLRVGDAVLAMTPHGNLAEARVVATQKSVVPWWLRLDVASTGILETTSYHPISTSSGWRQAGALRAGESIHTATGLMPLRAAEIQIGLLTVYDLSVDPYENFIAAGVVVHNKRFAHPGAEAIGDARSVSSSQVAYAASNNGAYGRMACLAAPMTCGFPAGTTPFLDSNIASLQPKGGYARSFLAGPAAKGSPDPGIEKFVYVAIPVKVGTQGSNHGFAIDSSGLICMTPDGSVPEIRNGELSPTCTPLK